MASPAARRSWTDSLAAIEQVAELSEGLSLVLIIGPSTHAEEGLTQIESILDGQRESLWHRLDRVGADLAATLSAGSLPSSLLLVHGLERLTAAARQDVEVRLNLLRDSLARFQTLIVLWIPHDELEAFRRNCPDLFQWRALVVQLAEDELPLSTDLVARRRYLQWISTFMGELTLPLAPEQTLAEVYIEPRVQVDGFSNPKPFAAWADSVQYGFLEGTVGSGKTAALEMYVFALSQRAVDDPEIPIPFWIVLRAQQSLPESSELDFLMATDLSSAALPLRPGALDNWARQEELELMIDGFDEIAQDKRDVWIEWLNEIRARYPRMRIIAAGRPGVVPSQGWQRAELVPWSSDQIETYLKRRFHRSATDTDVESLLRQARLRELSRSPLMLEIISSLSASSQIIPAKRSALLSIYADFLLNRWDAARELHGLRPSTSPQVLRRQLSALALQALRRGVDTFQREDLADFDSPEDSMRFLETRANLIREVSSGTYEFTHRVLFEHFAAEELVDLGPTAALQLIYKHMEDPSWREVIVMAVARLIRLTGLEEWLAEYFWPQDEASLAEEQLLYRKKLANDCASEAGIAKSVMKRRQPKARPSAGIRESRSPDLRNLYLQHVLERTGSLSLGGVDPAVAGSDADATLRLEAVYTALLTHTSRHQDDLAKHEPRRSPALEQLNLHDRLVLLGDPGSGKSTFVNFVALCLAGELLGSKRAHLESLVNPLTDVDAGRPVPASCWDHGALLPVRVVLRDFAARGLPEHGEAGTELLWHFLESELTHSNIADFGPHLKKILQRDGALIFLDGLDEVPEAEGRRKQILQAVGDFVATFRRCRFLVTCRTYAYRHQDWRLPGFTEAVLTPLDEIRIRHFVDRWYLHMAQLRGLETADAQGRAERLKAAIFGSDRLRPLAERPLLLTLMASLHAWRGGSLPEKREELYHDAVQLLLDFWEQRRVVVDAAGHPVVQQESLAEWLRVDRAQVRRLLNELAFRAHSSQPDLAGTADIAEQDFVSRLVGLSDNPDVQPTRLVEYLRDRAGLLIARGVGVYTFPHRTFQEYLAACHLTDHDFPYCLAELVRDDNKERWREVALLAGAKAARGSTANPWLLADALCYLDVGDERRTMADAHGAHLAGLVLCESAGLKEVGDRLEGMLRRVREWQVEVLSGKELPALDRVECGRSLARLGDPRAEAQSVEGMQFCWVPPGEFRMGTDKADQPGPWDGTPAGDPNIPYGFWVGRYPVTQAQFRVFVEVGGYQDQQYWPEAREVGMWQAGFSLEETVISEPKEYPEPFSLSNHPVIGVSWFEARAFCRWLTHQLRRREVLGEDWEVDLPSELEWEKAARGGFEISPASIHADAGEVGTAETNPKLAENPEPFRPYPWGKEIDGEKANWAATAVGSTSAVGCFPSGSSPHGCEEMSGNVWEWTRSRKEDYPYPETREARAERERFDPAARSWILRGGSHGSYPDVVRCATRLDFKPATRNEVVGFRVVCSPSGL